MLSKIPVEILLPFDNYSFKNKKSILIKKIKMEVITDYKTNTFLCNNKKDSSNFSRPALFYS